MTEPVVAQRVSVNAAGFANPLNLPANAEADSHIRVYGDNVLLVLGADYTLDGINDLDDLDGIDGVDIIIDADVLLADTYDTFTAEHVPPLDQDVDLASGGTLGRLYMAGLDAIMRRVQSVYQVFAARSLLLPPDVSNTNVELPLPEDRRGLVWKLDQDTGRYALVNTLKDPDTEPLTAATAAAAAAAGSAAAAAASATTAGTQATNAAASAAAAQAAAAEAGDLSALLNYLWPVGAKLEHFGPTAPANFLACDGSAVSRTTYAALFAVIGTTYGVGDGTTTFNLPTWNDGRFTRATGGNAAAQGVLQTEMLGPHTHPVTVDSGGAHTHTYSARGAFGANSSSTSTFRPSVGDGLGSTPTMTTTSNGDHTHTATAGNNSGTENRPRNSAVLVCIKY